MLRVAEGTLLDPMRRYQFFKLGGDTGLCSEHGSSIFCQPGCLWKKVLASLGFYLDSRSNGLAYLLHSFFKDIEKGIANKVKKGK